MKKKLKLLMWTSVGVISSVSLLTSCSTSWNKWKPGAGGNPEWEFIHKIAPPIKWQVRKKAEIMKSWNATTNTLDLSMLNNQFELYAMLGEITKLKQDNMKQIDQYYKYQNSKDPDLSWSGLQTYMNNISNITTINIQQNGVVDPTPIKLDITSAKKTLLDGFTGYNNKDIDPSKTTGIGTPPAQFHNGRQYDVEYHGLSPSGQPMDAFEVQGAGISLISNKVVQALLAIDGNFALNLSKLVNIPKPAFDGFGTFMTNINDFFDLLLNNKGFKDWVLNKGVDFRISPNGAISSDAPPPTTMFKGQAIIVFLKGTK